MISARRAPPCRAAQTIATEEARPTPWVGGKTRTADTGEASKGAHHAFLHRVKPRHEERHLRRAQPAEAKLFQASLEVRSLTDGGMHRGCRRVNSQLEAVNALGGFDYVIFVGRSLALIEITLTKPSPSVSFLDSALTTKAKGQAGLLLLLLRSAALAKSFDILP